MTHESPQDPYDPGPLAGRPYERDQAPLFLFWKMKKHWPALRELFGCDETGAAIMLSLWSEAETAGRWTSYTRRREKFHTQPFVDPFHTFNKRLDAIAFLEHYGLIDHFQQVPGERSWQSCMKGRPHLVSAVREVVERLGVPGQTPPRETIVLRTKEGEPVRLADTERLRRMQRTMEVLNEYVGSANVMVSVGGNFYSVPDATRRRTVEVHTLADEVRIFEDGALIAAHPVLEGRHGRRIEPGHRTIHAGRRRYDGQSEIGTILLGAGDKVAQRPLAFYDAIGQALAQERRA